ncbi:MAG: GntR family transcriptional regulator [Candidatus Brocadiia bacterium]
MMVELTTQETASGQAERVICDWIGLEVYGEGKRLPSERELARRIGVSRTTIRSVLENLENDGLIESDDAGRKVVTSRAVTNVRSVMSDTVAVLASSPEGLSIHSGQTTGWEDYIYQGVMHELGQNELHALTMSAKRVVEEGGDYLLGHRPRGVIALKEFMQSDRGSRTLLRLKEAGVPVTIYGDNGTIPEVDRVTSDHETGCYELTRWLLGQGCRRILPVWSTQTQRTGERRWLIERASGYEKALREAGEAPLPELSIPGAASLTEEVEGRRERFEVESRLYAGYLADQLSGEHRVDALMAASDGDVPTLCRASRLLGKEPQEDVLVVGYDNYWKDLPERKFESTPPAATMDKGNLEIGECLVELLEKRATGQLPAEPQQWTVEPELVVMRQSETSGHASDR